MSIDSFRKRQVINFIKDFEKYDVPFDYRMWQGISLYGTAKDEIYLYNKGKLSLDDIFLDPDSVLRNVMKLWSLDKKKFKKK